ncbi:MAG: DUF262 domain-containing protein [Xanthobacteraceae bacterium]
MSFEVFPLRNSAILYLYAEKTNILMHPDYQRMGDIWTLDKKQLLIDSIINNFDIPKIYFHDLRDWDRKAKHEFSIIDGRQRLEAIWGFIDGEFTLSEDFEHLTDKRIKAAGLTYKELSSKYPRIKQLFDATSLSVFIVQTDDTDLIEEMFSRLNEAVPLNAAEKRNALGGPLPKIVRELTNTSFFKKNLKISNKRYQHRDLAAKMLYLTYSKKVLDTKKVYLDSFFLEAKNKSKSENEFRKSITSVRKTLSAMSAAFTVGDKLLKSSGMAILYYLLFERAQKESWGKKLSRSTLQTFEVAREKNRKVAERDITKANYDLLEFDRLTQTPNDAYAIKLRTDLLERFVKKQPS